MAVLHQLPRAWYATAGLAAALAGCTSVPWNPLASKAKEPAATAVSGAGNFAPDDGLKNPAKVHLAYGQWQEQMGQQAEARESYNKVLALQPKNLEAILGLARIDQAAGLISDAETRLKKASKLAPKDPRVLATYGNFYAAQRDWKKAIDKHEAAVKLAPEDPRYQFLLGVAMARSGDAEAAYPYFVRSVGDAQAHYNLGYILLESGDRNGCQEHLEQALALKPDLTIAQSMLDRLNQPGGNTVLAKGTDRLQSGNTTLPASAVRAVPVTRREEFIPNQPPQDAGYPAPAISPSATAPAAASRFPQPPAGLTPAQLEQWRNQQGQ